MMIVLTDHNDDLMYHFFRFLLYILSLLVWCFISHVTLCVRMLN